MLKKFLILFLCVMAFQGSSVSYARMNKAERLKIALRNYRQKNYSKALTLVKKNLETKPLHQGSMELLAVIYQKQKTYKKAIKSYQILINNFYDDRILKFKTLRSLKSFHSLVLATQKTL